MEIPAPFDNMECIILSPFRNVGVAAPLDAASYMLHNSVEAGPPMPFADIESKILSPFTNVEIAIPSNLEI